MLLPAAAGQVGCGHQGTSEVGRPVDPHLLAASDEGEHLDQDARHVRMAVLLASTELDRRARVDHGLPRLENGVIAFSPAADGGHLPAHVAGGVVQHRLDPGSCCRRVAPDACLCLSPRPRLLAGDRTVTFLSYEAQRLKPALFPPSVFALLVLPTSVRSSLVRARLRVPGHRASRVGVRLLVAFMVFLVKSMSGCGGDSPDDSTMAIPVLSRIRAFTDLLGSLPSGPPWSGPRRLSWRRRCRRGQGVACEAMDALVFPSEEWVAAWTSRCNASAAYLAAASGWDGVVALEIGPDDDHLSEPLYVRLCAQDGQWTSFRFGPDRALAEHPSFLLTARYATWKQLVRQEIDPVRAIMRGTVRVQGRLSELFAWSDSLQVMTGLAGQVDTIFADRAPRA